MHSSEKASLSYETIVMPLLLQVVEDFHPDIIHVFGSENIFGLIANHTKIPVVLHIQGVLNPCLNAFLPPFYSWRDYVFRGKTIKSIYRNMYEKKVWQRNAVIERRILKSVRYYMGRTGWDKRVIGVENQDAHYFHCDEILRDAFYCLTDSAREIPNKAIFVTTISDQLYKGLDAVLKTAKLLKSIGLEFEWHVYGWSSPRAAESLAKCKSHDVNIRFMGVATAEELGVALLRSTAYVHLSYIDNSPNSVCEAQILGVPVIASNVGGIPSLIKDGKTGYLVPANDPWQTAYLMRLLACDKQKNTELGINAKTIALIRHDKSTIKGSVLEVYRYILSQTQNG